MLPEALLVGATGAAAWLSREYAWWRPPVDWRHPRILMYHMVRPHRPGARFNKLRVPPVEFARQIRWLRENEFTFVFASQLFSGESLPDRSVCLTFDDGYEDNLLAADPVLERHDAVATLYLVGDRTGGWSSKKKAHHEDDELRSEPKLHDDHVRSMLASGRWELGGHTKTHANLSTLSNEEARNEITAARNDCLSNFGHLPATFAYPFGIFESSHARMAAEAGYVGAVTVEPGISRWPYDNPMTVNRVKISGKDGLVNFILRMRGGKRGWSR